MKKSNLWILVLLISLVFTACSSDDDDDNQPDKPNKTEMLAKKWIAEEATTAALGKVYQRGASNNQFDFDNSYVEFKKNGTYDLLILEQEQGTWAFTNNETQAVLTSTNEESTTYTLISLTDTTLEFSFDSYYQGFAITVTVKMKPE